MNIAFFGGSFDPVHRGHIQIAAAALERFGIGRVLFVPAYIQPLKQNQQIAAYHQRLAMVALSTQGNKAFTASDLEAPPANSGPSYSFESVRRLKRTLRKADKLYFLLGVDAFLGIAKWHKASELLRECEFIIASRPGFSMGAIAAALPEGMRPRKHVLQIAREQEIAKGSIDTIALNNTTLHLMGDIFEQVSSTQIRAAAKSGRARLAHLVGEPVAEYIQKTGLYRAQEAASGAQKKSSGRS
jgi:nicotinate-nucleotide adenylyltransferase